MRYRSNQLLLSLLVVFRYLFNRFVEAVVINFYPNPIRFLLLQSIDDQFFQYLFAQHRFLWQRLLVLLGIGFDGFQGAVHITL
ncbi:Uncharacterised protein [Vibrio cholerae]|nr:Uncharacterised protein [Vibrio cholerae]